MRELGIRPAWLVSVVGLALGVAYAFVVPAGLPYDEPAHWANVQYYAEHWRLPVLGDPGTWYEAQMGPVAYVVDAVLVRLVTGLGGSEMAAFHAVRLLGVLELVAAALLLAVVLRRVLPARWAALAAAVVFGLNPMLLVMSASVQNDTLALLLGILVLALCVRLPDRAVASCPSLPWASGVGALIGLAVLTKLTAWPLLVVPVWLAWRFGRRALGAAAVMLAASAAVCGWWFVRNWLLYGDLTARTAVEQVGVSFGPFRVEGLSGVVHVIQQAVTYLWLPTEYLRNTISAPGWLKALVVLLTLAVAVAAVLRRRELRGSGPLAGLLAVVAVVAVAAWLGTYLLVQAVAPRVAYLALPAWYVAIGLTLSG